MITIKLPALPHGLFSNLLGIAGLIAVIVAVGGLTHNWWWSLLAAGFVATGLSYIAQVNRAAVEQVNEEPTEIPRLAGRSRSA